MTRAGWRRQLAQAAAFIAGDAAGKGAGVLAGVLIARWLSVEAYALYTIATTASGALSLLTQGGLAIGFSARLGRIWPNPARAGAIVAAALAVRAGLTWALAPLVIAIALTLAHRAGAALFEAAAIGAFLATHAWAEMRSRVIDQTLFFAGQAVRVQALDAALSAGRLAGVAALQLAGALGVATALALGALGSTLRIRPIRRWVDRVAPRDPGAPIDADRAALRDTAIRQLPVDLYQALFTQGVIAALALFGTPAAVAGYGALTRITQLMGPVDGFMLAFLVPRFAQARSRRDGGAGVVAPFFAMLAFCAAPSLGLALLAVAAPSALLWIIGANYADLTAEMAIAGVVLGFTVFARSAWRLLAHRGWSRHAWVQIPAGLGFTALIAVMVDIETLSGALILSGAYGGGLAIAAAVELIAAHRRGET